jgi:hypothetical protein
MYKPIEKKNIDNSAHTPAGGCLYHLKSTPFEPEKPHTLDIEELVTHGRNLHFCPYYYTRSKHPHAEVSYK